MRKALTTKFLIILRLLTCSNYYIKILSFTISDTYQPIANLQSLPLVYHYYQYTVRKKSTTQKGKNSSGLVICRGRDFHVPIDQRK